VAIFRSDVGKISANSTETYNNEIHTESFGIVGYYIYSL
jgi:hypothetical protein